jgi:hypothetical protein
VWSIAALLSGLVVGAITTTYHSAWFPGGVIVSILVVMALVAGLRVISPTRVPATWAAVGVVVVMTALAGFDGQGSVLIASNTAGLVFLGSITLVTLVILAWPRLAPRATRYDEVSSDSERSHSS